MAEATECKVDRAMEPVQTNGVEDEEREQRPSPPSCMKAMVEAERTPKGGFTRKSLAAFGVEWPPRKGWRKALLEECTACEDHRACPDNRDPGDE